jgi:hypothetical protein
MATQRDQTKAWKSCDYFLEVLPRLEEIQLLRVWVKSVTKKSNSLRYVHSYFPFQVHFIFPQLFWHTFA